MMTVLDRLRGELRDSFRNTLRAYLPGQRWFGAKGRPLTSIEVDDYVPLPGTDTAVIAVLRARIDGDIILYQFPLLLDGAGSDRDRLTVAAPSGSIDVADATGDVRFRDAYARAIAAGAVSAGERWRWHADPVGDGAGELRAAADRSRRGSAEQSNTSLIYDDRVMVKLFRRLEFGDNPDPEIGTALTRAGFPHVPRVVARVRLTSAEGSADAALAQRFVAGSVDAWSWTLSAARPFFGAPPDAEPASDFEPAAHRLGAVTRGLHDALGGITEPGFGADRAGERDVRDWERAAIGMIDRALERLAGALRDRRLPAIRAAEAGALVRRGDAYRDHARRAAAAAVADAGARIRHHGDYHLGQVLRDPAGELHVIDFEGEPARPLAERRAPNSPLRDVAGMLRSFGYAAAMLLAEVEADLPMDVRELRAARWERDARRAFLEGYRPGDPGRILPARRAATEALITLFETEKAFYELAYELDNRPEWSWIPMRGISKLLVPVRGARA